MTTPLISVIVPVYRVEEYLERCVKSILSQTYKNLEVILVDDGSPDQCPAICDACAEKDVRVKVIHQENKGLSGARNAGIDAASGEYLAFVDSVDYVSPHFIEELYQLLQDTGCAIVIIAHMNKAKDTSPLYRTNGSIDIAGAARSILAVTRTANKQNPAERYLVQVKSNLAPMGSAILFEVADKGVNFLDELELSAEDAFSASAPRMGRPNAREEAATDFIRFLMAGGRRLASDCEAKLEAAGFKKSTYKKSKKKAGVRSVKDGFLWYWTLPEVEKTIENGQEVTDEDDLPI